MNPWAIISGWVQRCSQFCALHCFAVPIWTYAKNTTNPGSIRSHRIHFFGFLQSLNFYSDWLMERCPHQRSLFPFLMGWGWGQPFLGICFGSELLTVQGIYLQLHSSGSHLDPILPWRSLLATNCTALTLPWLTLDAVPQMHRASFDKYTWSRERHVDGDSSNLTVYWSSGRGRNPTKVGVSWM